MKSTTASQLAEQAYQDYQKESQPSDRKGAVAFMFNNYAAHYGLPSVIRLTSHTSTKFAKVAAVALKSLGHHIKPGSFRSLNWMVSQVVGAWELTGMPSLQ